MFKIIEEIKNKIINSKNENKKQVLKEYKSKIKEDLFNHLEKTQFIEHKGLMKEILYLIHYSFLVLEDDYYKGDKILSKGITKLDDYIFSKYKNNPILEENIKKLSLVAFSNRFEDEPKENFLSYFVFIEELDFDLTLILDNYYCLLSNKKLSKPSKKSKELELYNKDETRILMTEKITTVMSNKAQKIIINSNLEEKD